MNYNDCCTDSDWSFSIFQRVQDTLRDHASAVLNPPSIRAARVQSNRTNYDTTAIWKKIYANADLYDWYV